MLSPLLLRAGSSTATEEIIIKLEEGDGSSGTIMIRVTCGCFPIVPFSRMRTVCLFSVSVSAERSTGLVRCGFLQLLQAQSDALRLRYHSA